MKSIFVPIVMTMSLNLAAQLSPLGSGVFHWNDLPVKKESLRESRKIMEGLTTEFSYFEIHATTQLKGAVSRPPHAQKDLEEVIIIKEGVLHCIIGDKAADLGPGSVLLIPPGEMQTYENRSDGPVTYYVLMFRSKKPADMDRSGKAGGALLIKADTITYTEKDLRGTQKYFDRATAMCERFEMHVTTLKKPGPSHDPHQHLETEMMLIIDGDVEMIIDGINYKGTSGDLFLVESGKMHGISNASARPCRYFAYKWR